MKTCSTVLDRLAPGPEAGLGLLGRIASLRAQLRALDADPENG